MAPPTPPASRFAGAVLCGGRSTRMGADKALVELAGRPLAAHVRAALQAAGAEPVVAVGGDASRLAQLGFSVVADGWPGEGPLGGIATALAAVQPDRDRTGAPPGPGGTGAEVVVVSACDTPFVRPRTFGRLAALVRGDVDAAVVRAGGRRQPLVVAVHRRTRPAIEAALAEGERRPRVVLDGLRLAELEVDGDEVRDLDTPADLAAARAGPGPTAGLPGLRSGPNAN